MIECNRGIGERSEKRESFTVGNKVKFMLKKWYKMDSFVQNAREYNGK